MPKQKKKPTCPTCSSDHVRALAWVDWLPQSNRFSVRHVMEGQWACLECDKQGREWIDFDPLWIDA